MLKNRFILFFTCIFSMFAVAVAGISTFAWFQQTYNTTNPVNGGTVSSGSTDLTIDGVTGYKYAYDDTGNGIDYSSGHVTSYAASGNAHTNIAQDEAGSALDAPKEGVGFYIKGDDTWSTEYGGGRKAWTYNSSVRLEDKYGVNYAALLNYNFHANEEIKIYWHHYVNGTTKDEEVNTLGDNVTTYVTQTADFKNLKFKTDGIYDIWVAGKPSTPTIYITLVASLTNNQNSTSNDNTDELSENIALHQTNDLKTSINKSIKRAAAAGDYYLKRGGNSWGETEPLTRDPNDSNHYYIYGILFSANEERKIHCTTSNIWFDAWENWGSSANLSKGNNNGNTNIRMGNQCRCNIDFYLTDSKSFVSDCYYLKGDFNSWGTSYMMRFNTSKQKYELTGLDITASNQEFKIHGGYHDTWYGHINNLRPTSSDGSSSNFTGENKDGNIKCQLIGRYNLLFSFSSNLWKLETEYGTYSVNLETNGGTINSGNITSYVFKTGATLPTDITKSDSTFAGWYATSDFSDSKITSISNTDYGDKTFYAKFVDNTYYTMHIYKKLFSAQTQSYNDPVFVDSYDIISDAEHKLSISTVIDTSKFAYSSSSYSWSNKWYEDPDFNTQYSTPKIGGTSSNHFNLYTYIEEKTATLKIYTAERRNNQNSYNSPKQYNIKQSTFTATLYPSNAMKWGITQNKFNIENYFVKPSVGTNTTTNYYSALGWAKLTSLSIPSNQATDTSLTAANSSVLFPSNTTYYIIFLFEETPFTITIEKKFFFSDGTTSFNLTNSVHNHELSSKVYGTISAYNSQESSIYIGNIEISDEAFTYEDKTQDKTHNNGYYNFSRDANTKLYVDEACETPFTGPITKDKTLYAKMVAHENIVFYVRKPDGNGSNYIRDKWITLRANLFGSGIQSTTLDFNSQNYMPAFDYIDAGGGDRFYAISIPTTASMNIVGISDENTLNDSIWVDNDKEENTKQTPDITVNSVDYKGKTKGDSNSIQLWDNSDHIDDKKHYMAKWHWDGTKTNNYYLIGENLLKDTSGMSEQEVWTIENGIKMNVGDSSTPDCLAYIKKVSLSENVKFKIRCDLTRKWYGYNYIETETSETKYLVEDDNLGDHNIKMKAGVSGIFNIYLLREGYKIIIEDASKSAYMYFTNATGIESSDKFEMGAGGYEYDYHDGDNNILVYERGINVRTGDKFAIRNKFHGVYTWYDASALDEASKTYAKTASSTYELGDMPSSGTTVNAIKSVTPIEFTKPGLFTFYVYRYYDEETQVESFRISIAPAGHDGYGYYAIDMGSSTNMSDALINSDGATKLRAIGYGSNTNIAMYTGYYMQEGHNYVFKSQTYVYKNGSNTLTESTYTNFYDQNLILNSDISNNKDYFSRNIDSAYVNLAAGKTGYYDIYIYSDNSGYRVSFAESKINSGNFFTLNGLRTDRIDEEDLYSGNTTLIIQVDFTVKCLSNSVINMDLILDGTGLGSYLGYYCEFDTDLRDEENDVTYDPYKYFRNKHYDDLTAPSVQSLKYLDISTSNNDSENKQSHTAYIMIDYISGENKNTINSLIALADKSNNFRFVLRSSQA